MLYRIVREELATFLAHTEHTYAGPLPRYVIDTFEHYLQCGDLARGFLRCHCGGCGNDVLVAFSCKARGICPSCGARRMCNEAAQLVDRVLPNVSIRQWVLSLTKPLAGRIDGAETGCVTADLERKERRFSARLSLSQAQMTNWMMPRGARFDRSSLPHATMQLTRGRLRLSLWI